MFGGQLNRHPSQPFGKLQVGLHLLVGDQRDRFAVQAALETLFLQGIDHLVGDLFGHLFLRLLGGGPEVRGTDDTGMLQQLVQLLARRLLRIDIHGDTSYISLLDERPVIRFLIDSAARTVDQEHPFLQLVGIFHRHDPPGFFIQRSMHRQNIAGAQ